MAQKRTTRGKQSVPPQNASQVTLHSNKAAPPPQSPQNHISLWEWLKTVWRWFFGTFLGVFAIITGIVANLVQIGLTRESLWQVLISFFGLVILVLLLIPTCYSLFIRKTKNLRLVSQVGLALISLGITAAILSIAATILFAVKPDDKIASNTSSSSVITNTTTISSTVPITKVKILVARFYNFEKGEDKDNEVTDTVFGDLKKAMRPFSDVELEPLGKAITELNGGSDTANKLGQERQADLVIWGSYVEKPDGKQLRTHFDVMTSTAKLKYMPALGKEAQGEVRLFPAELNSLTFTIKLAKEMTYLSLVAAGVAHHNVRLFHNPFYKYPEALRQTYDDGAIDKFTAALSQTTEDVPALNKRVVYFLRGDAYRQKGNSDLAIQDYTKAIELNLKDAFVYYNRARLYLIKGNSDLAIQDYTEAIRLNPKYSKDPIISRILSGIPNSREKFRLVKTLRELGYDIRLPGKIRNP